MLPLTPHCDGEGTSVNEPSLLPKRRCGFLEWAVGTRPLIRADQQMSAQAAARYRAAIAQQVAHTPLQHITGEMDFRYLTLAAGPGFPHPSRNRRNAGGPGSGFSTPGSSPNR